MAAGMACRVGLGRGCWQGRVRGRAWGGVLAGWGIGCGELDAGLTLGGGLSSHPALCLRKPL